MRPARIAFAAVLAAVPAGAAGCGGGGSHPAGSGATPGATRAPTAFVPRPRWPDDARYALDLRYDARRYALAGRERVSFVNTGPRPLRAVWLRAWANAYGGCRAARAHVALLAGGSLGRRERDCTAQEIHLPRPLAPGARAEVGLRVRVTAPPGPDRFGRWRGVAYFGNALPILAVADRTGWHLPPYTFRGESFFSLTSAWTVRLRVSTGVAVAATGTQRRRSGNRVTLTAPRARDFAIVAGPMRVTTLRDGDLTLRHWRLRGTPASEAARVLRVARAAMRSYARWYGPYDRPELDVVEAPTHIVHGGIAMEYPELVLTPAFAPAVAHEVAHQWWYGIVGDDQWKEPWVDESFAEYSAERLPARVYGARPRRRCRPPPPRLRARLDSSMAVFDRGAASRYVRVVYAGGPCLLRALAAHLGQARFDRVLRGLVAAHRDGVLTTGEIVAALHAAAPGDRVVARLLRSAGVG